MAAVLVAVKDFQSDDNILRNFPLIGRLRSWWIRLGPELRQYTGANNPEEAPFNREEYDWVDRSTQGGHNYFGFGADEQAYALDYPIIKHAVFPYGDIGYKGSSVGQDEDVACAKILGAAHGRPKAWRPASIVNISAMSFGALSGPAIEALNRGALLAGCWHNSGEGGLSPHHNHGADVIFQLGAGYFGCRELDGRFSMEKLFGTIASCPTVRGVEIKLSQGAKPGSGGVLPGRKVTSEVAAVRGVRAGRDCVSPAEHSAFSDVRSLIEFIERIAQATGLPVGIKSAVGSLDFWKELAQQMKASGRGPDWITIDGSEGGTGAIALTPADHASLPYKLGFTRVYKIFLDEGLAESIVWIGGGKLGFPHRAVVAFCLGADLINVAREAMLAIGCVQTQTCHTNLCPTGVASHNFWLQHGLLPAVQAERFARYCRTFRNELLAVTRACEYEHPSLFTADDVEIASGPGTAKTLREIYGYTPTRPARA